MTAFWANYIRKLCVCKCFMWQNGRHAKKFCKTESNEHLPRDTQTGPSWNNDRPETRNLCIQKGPPSAHTRRNSETFFGQIRASDRAEHSLCHKMHLQTPCIHMCACLVFINFSIIQSHTNVWVCAFFFKYIKKRNIIIYSLLYSSADRWARSLNK